MYCQQLLSVVKLGGVCVPFKHKVKACTCSETYICIGYVLPTIVDVHLYWIYSANNCGVLFSWGLTAVWKGFLKKIECQFRAFNTQWDFGSKSLECA